MRSLGAHEDSVDFLSQLDLRVAKDEDSEMAYMFDAPADQKAQLTEWVLLGTLYSGGEIDLEVTLDVPVSLDNNYKNLIGYLDWQFKVEEFPIDDGPKTGDDTNLILWIAVLALCVMACAVAIVMITKKRNREN